MAEMTADQTISDALAGLAAGIKGTIHWPGEEGYDRARAVWNGMIDRRPRLVVTCTCTSDVARAVAFAAAHELAISIKGGGHNVAGHAVADGALMLDLSGMRAVTVDPAGRIARVRAARFGQMSMPRPRRTGLRRPAG